VGALDRDDGEEVDLAAGFGDLDDGGESGEAAAYYDDSWGCCCHYVLPIVNFYVCRIARIVRAMNPIDSKTEPTSKSLIRVRSGP
jgi:hypothetical protein